MDIKWMFSAMNPEIEILYRVTLSDVYSRTHRVRFGLELQMAWPIIMTGRIHSKLFYKAKIKTQLLEIMFLLSKKTVMAQCGLVPILAYALLIKRPDVFKSFF